MDIKKEKENKGFSSAIRHVRPGINFASTHKFE